MENKEAPIPETIELNKVKKFYILKDNNNYILTCLKDVDSLVLNIKPDSKLINFYYEAKYNKENLLKISKI